MATKKQLDELFMGVAEKFAEMSHCVSYKVGAIIVQDERIVSTGWNGTPKGYDKNCDDYFDNSLNFNRDEHINFSDMREIHSEMNAILFCARSGIKIEGSTLYTTVQPCIHCTKNIIQSGIKRVVYRDEYDRVKNNVDLIQFIKDNKVEFEQL